MDPDKEFGVRHLGSDSMRTKRSTRNISKAPKATPIMYCVPEQRSKKHQITQGFPITSQAMP